MIFSVDHILQAGGILAVALIIFAECGLLVGFFLPGDTLLIAAGIFASEHKLNIFALLPVVIIAAIAGYQVGYQIGWRGGPKLFKRKDGLLFREDYIPRTEKYVTRHGGKTMVLARFIAVIRTLVPLVAGIGKMRKSTFLFYNIIGAIIWISSITLGSYWVGNRVENVDRFIIPVVIIGIALTAGAEFWFVLRNKSSRRQLIEGLREEYRYFFKKKV
ncbi:MAG: VTT domain-containing protein [Candidatus Saccharimonadales bacterium]|jgi:membrane-associated protein